MSYSNWVRAMKIHFSQDHLLMIFLLLVTVASGADLIADLSQGVDIKHIVQESIIMLIAASAFIWLAKKYKSSKSLISNLQNELDSIKNVKQPKEVVAVKKQLSEAIANQFNEWNLTQSEREIGLLLLKGFSLKEIAALRGTAEKTIRQQSSSIYSKAGLPGRHAFSAWFIEDIL